MPEQIESVIVDAVGCGSEVRTGHPVHHEEGVPTGDCDDFNHGGDAGACSAGQHRHIRLVLELLFGCGKRRFVLEIAVEEEAGRFEQPIGVALVPAERLDEEPAARGVLDRIGRRAAGVDVERGRDGVGETECFHCCDDGRPRNDPTRRPEHQVDRRSDGPAEEPPPDHVEREMGTHIDAR